jgi:putative membrane protein
MLMKNGIKGVLGLSVLAAWFAVAAVQAQTPATDTAKPAAASTLVKSDQQLIQDLAQANMAEIESARMALGKSQNDEVRKFAQQMIDDHTRALEEVRQLAQSKGITLPSALERNDKRMADKLSTQSGDAFDRAYLDKAGVAEHKKTHAMLHKAQPRIKDADLKALVARTMPLVDQHLSAVQQLHKDTTRGSSKTEGTTGTSRDRR